MWVSFKRTNLDNSFLYTTGLHPHLPAAINFLGVKPSLVRHNITVIGESEQENLDYPLWLICEFSQYERLKDKLSKRALVHGYPENDS